MQALLMLLLAGVLLSATYYAHQNISSFTRTAFQVTVTRFLLIAVGIAFGLFRAVHYEGGLLQMMAFLIGFGLVHLPAAIILFIKSKRGAGKS